MKDSVACHCLLRPCILIAINPRKIPRLQQVILQLPGEQYPLIFWQQPTCPLLMTFPGCFYSCPWRIGHEAGYCWAEGDRTAVVEDDFVVVVVVVVVVLVVALLHSLATLFCTDSSTHLHQLALNPFFL